MNKEIALINPSDNKIKDYEKYLNCLEEFNTNSKYKLKISNNEGDSSDKISDLVNAYEDKKIDALLCTNGGSTSINLVDGINELIKKNNNLFLKPLIGYSDIDHLSLLLASKKHPTIHGYNLKDLCEYHSKKDIDVLLQILNNEKIVLDVDQSFNFKEVFEGEVIISNLQILIMMIPYLDPKYFHDKIIFIEDHTNKDEMVNYYLKHLIKLHDTSKFKGIVIGNLRNCVSKKDILDSLIKKIHIPVIDIKEWSYLPTYLICEVYRDKMVFRKNETN